MSGVAERFRDVFRRYIPYWLSDRSLSSGKSVGYRFLWSMIAPLDVYEEVLLQGLQAAWPGRGTPTALPLIGRSRGIIRGMIDTNEEYAEKLRGWLDRARGWGSAIQLAIELHDYLGSAGGHPRVRVVNRAGYWVTVNEDRSIVTNVAPWDWDSISHPERAGFWSDEWVIIYPPPWNHRTGTMATITNDGHALGHQATLTQVDEVKGILAQVKGAHSRVRAVIWCMDPDLFDPTDPPSCPNGKWGGWGGTGNGSRTFSDRNYVNCRYWEPR